MCAVTMSSVQTLREFINERLTAAAEEIFTEFEKTIVYYEEEIDRRRRLLDISWNPLINSQIEDVPRHHKCKEDVLTDQRLCIQERSFSLDWEEPEPPQVKEEQEEFCTDLYEEHFVLKQETDTVMVTSAYEEKEHSEPDPNGDQVTSQGSPEAKNQDWEGNRNEDSGSPIDVELNPKDCPERTKHEGSHSDEDVSPISEHQFETEMNKPVKCDVCGRAFKYNYQMKDHRRIHTGERPFSCKMCGKRFKRSCGLLVHSRIHTGHRPYSCKICCKSFTQRNAFTCHMRTHSGEKPYTCETCGKSFTVGGQLTIHTRSHTGEKPYSCNTCGKCYSRSRSFNTHMRTHTGEKPFSCKICGKCFSENRYLTEHMRTHSGERPYPCTICGKRFKRSDDLLNHCRIHTGEKPYCCKICGKRFTQSGHLTAHIRTHTGEKPPPTSSMSEHKHTGFRRDTLTDNR